MSQSDQNVIDDSKSVGDLERRAFIKRLARAGAIAPVASLLFDASANAAAYAVGT